MEYEFKSEEEKYFADWLDELKQADFVESWAYEPETFTLAEAIEFPCQKQMKTKVKEETFPAMKPVEYTYDFKIDWKLKAAKILFWVPATPYFKKSDIIFFNDAGFTSYIDIKGMFKGKNNTSAYTAPIKIKWLYQKHGIYVQIIKAMDLFKKTFYPKSYFFTGKGKDKCKRIKGVNTPIKELPEFKTIDKWIYSKNKMSL